MRSGGRFTSSSAFGGAVAGAAAFLVYLRTLAPGVTFIDSGELATAACRLGIAHPTGYPLFTLLGSVVSRIPFAPEEILRLNIMAALLCAAGVFVFFLLMHHLLERGPEGQPVGPRLLLLGASAGGSILLAFSETYWSQALAVEVYSLHLFLLACVVYAFVRSAFPAEERVDGGAGAWWYLFAFLLGLSFSNHMTTILLAPGMLYLYFSTQGGGTAAWARIGRMVPFFVLGLSVYLYMPVRAGESPVANWGYTATLERFLWHVSGKQYRVWIFSSTEAAGRQLKYFIDSFPREFAYVGPLLAIPGIVRLWRVHRRLLFASLFWFLTCVLYSINYDIHDIDSYFLLAYFSVALWAAFGLLGAGLWLARVFSLRTWIAAGAIVLCSLPPLIVHYRGVDQSRDTTVDCYTKAMFSSLAPRALVFSYQWDYWVSASYYYQYVKGYRPDVAVIDKELLRRSWYLREIASRHPWLVEGSRPEIDAFENEVAKFEHELPYNPAVIQARYEGMIASMIRHSIAERPVYVTREIEPEFTRGYQRVPEGLAFRLWGDSLFHSSLPLDLTLPKLENGGKMHEMVRRLSVEAFVARAEYYYRVGRDPAEAEKAMKMALALDPSNIALQRRQIQSVK